MGTLPERAGWEQLEFTPLGQQSGLFQYRGYYHTPLQVHGKTRCDSPYLIVRLPQSGRSRLYFPGHQGVEEGAGRFGIYFRSPNANCIIENRVGEINSLVAPMISARKLRALLEGQDIPEPLRSFLDGEITEFFATAKFSAKVRRLAADIQGSPYSGSMRSLHLQGKIFELLAEIVSELSGSRPSHARTLGPEQRKAMMARDIIMAELADPPDAESLARRVGLSQRRLNEVFRDLYGDSVFKCLAKWRLQMARDLLLDNELPIKMVAHQVGYSHVNNFILAFSRHFGDPPATFRKQAASKRD